MCACGWLRPPWDLCVVGLVGISGYGCDRDGGGRVMPMALSLFVAAFWHAIVVFVRRQEARAGIEVVVGHGMIR